MIELRGRWIVALIEGAEKGNGKRQLGGCKPRLFKPVEFVYHTGFVPDDVPSVEVVQQFRNSGFELIWFDGNRQAALKYFQGRNTVSVSLYELQMKRIEDSKIIERLKPTIIDPVW